LEVGCRSANKFRFKEQLQTIARSSHFEGFDCVKRAVWPSAERRKPATSAMLRPDVQGSCARSAAIPFQRGFDAVDQDGSSERLGQKTNGSGFQRAGADAIIGKRRDKNKRRFVAHGADIYQEVQAAHGRHLHVRNHTRRVAELGRLQELLSRGKRLDWVSMRGKKIIGRGADGCIVVNN
jgi:hypothetical protein